MKKKYAWSINWRWLKHIVLGLAIFISTFLFIFAPYPSFPSVTNDIVIQAHFGNERYQRYLALVYLTEFYVTGREVYKKKSDYWKSRLGVGELNPPTN